MIDSLRDILGVPGAVESFLLTSMGWREPRFTKVVVRETVGIGLVLVDGVAPKGEALFHP